MLSFRCKIVIEKGKKHMSSNTHRLGAVAALVSAAALAAPALAIAAPLGSTDSTKPTCSTLSTEKDPAGWGVPFTDEKGQEASYSAANIFDTDGSLELSVTTSSDRAAWYHSAGSLPLADILTTDIGFDEKSATRAASFQLRLLSTEGGKFDNGFTTLVWVADSGTDTSGGITHTAIQNGKWWSTQNINGAPGRVPTTLAAIAAANKDATVEHYGVSVGTGSTNTTALVDAVTFNGCTTNFAKTAPTTPGTGSLGNLFGSLS